ncbi:MAG TPA: glycosyltransferase family A protein [Actinomycetota bacterium]|jgi:glycosyltransferase involved in cell wall biosynthesis|nr:glycosyltransferase family A protein [Actinomycetota bacterium]
MPPEVTVLTAVRNGARFLAEAIESIRAQTLDDWEHVIVDDASEDDTVALIERVAAADARVRLIRRRESGGPYVAANDGLEAAEGRYIARLDADDVAVPDRLERQLQFLDAHPTLRACGGMHRVLVDGRLSKPVAVPLLPGVLRWRLCAGADPVHSSLFAEHSAMSEIGGYAPLPLAQDWRVWCELSRRGWLGIVPQVVVHRRLHADRVSVRESARQSQHAVDVAREHIRELTGEEWSTSDVEAFRNAAHGWPVDFAAGWRAIDRWSARWRVDERLDRAEVAQLRSWTRFLKRRFVVRSTQRLPVAGALVRLGSSGVRITLRAAAAVKRGLGH